MLATFEQKCDYPTYHETHFRINTSGKTKFRSLWDHFQVVEEANEIIEIYIWPNSQKHDRSASKTVPKDIGPFIVPPARRLALHACSCQQPLQQDAKSTQNSPTRFKKALTWPETQSITCLLQVNTKTSKSLQQRVSVKYTLPSTQPFTAGPQTTHQQVSQGLGYASMLALTEPPLGFEKLA